jgi:hypothetical protein
MFIVEKWRLVHCFRPNLGLSGYRAHALHHHAVWTLPAAKQGASGATPSSQTAPLLDRGFAQGRLENVLYATRCSAQNFRSASSVTPPLRKSCRQCAISSNAFIQALSGLIGAFTGLLCSADLPAQSWHGATASPRHPPGQRARGLPAHRIQSGHPAAPSGRRPWRAGPMKTASPSPLMFLSELAEARGFIGQITKLVVRHALRDFRETFQQVSRLPPQHQCHRVRPRRSPQFLPMLANSHSPGRTFLHAASQPS